MGGLLAATTASPYVQLARLQATRTSASPLGGGDRHPARHVHNGDS